MQRKRSSWYYTRTILQRVVRHPANAEHRARAVWRALGWQVRKRRSSQPVDVPFEGFTMRCYPDSASASNVHYFTSRFDFHEMGLLERYLRPGDGFIDVGANVGTYVLLAASLVGPTGRIVAIEPLPRAAARLREHLDLNGIANVEVHEVAVGANDDLVDFIDFDVSSGVDLTGQAAGRLTVPLRRIDDLVAGVGFAAAKLDVEGFELEALRGARGRLARADPPVWIVELYAWLLEKQGAKLADLASEMRAAGFEAARYDHRTGVLERAPDAWRTPGDCLFVASRRWDEVADRLLESSPSAGSGAGGAAPST